MGIPKRSIAPCMTPCQPGTLCGMQDPRDGRWWLAGEDGVGTDKPHEVIDKVIASR